MRILHHGGAPAPLLALVLALALPEAAAAAQTGPSLPAYDPGPYAVGVRSWNFGTFPVTEPGSGGASTLDVDHFGVLHYPATVAGTGTPLAEGAFPMVVFSHGRFQLGSAVGTNHLQAAYLLDHLASHGFVVASVNLDVVGQFASPAAIFQRSELIHATIDAFERDPYGWGPGVDFSRIGLVGHSRGGDACIRAWFRNEDADHPIAAIATIAPTEFNQSIQLEAVPYLSLYGSKDGDVNNGMPIRAFDRAFGAPKVFEYVEGANHFWFTESLQFSGEGNADIPRALHHEIARTYITYFLLSTMGGPVPQSFAELSDGASLSVVTNQAAIHPIYSDPDALTFNDFEDEPADPDRNSLNGQSREGNVTLFTEQFLASPAEDLYHRTNGLALAWESPTAAAPFYLEFSNQPVDAGAYGFVSLDALQLLTGSENVPGMAQDLRVVVIDAAGGRAFVRLSDYGTIPWPVTHAGGQFPEKNVLRTTRIPLADFAAAGPGIDLSQLRALGIVMDETPSGNLRIDGLRLTD